jgi:hypothetical protein
MDRPRWHDWVIAVAIAAIAAVGVLALWGESLAEWIEGPEAQPAAEALPGARRAPL